MIITRVLSGILFEFDSPSCLRPVGLPVELRSNGRNWQLELLRSNGQRTSSQFSSRDEAVAFIATALQGTAFATYGAGK